jgi:mannose-6-phosphate isomerase-like protein (cupin superfamily)
MVKCINRETLSTPGQLLLPLLIQPPAEPLEIGPRGMNIRRLVKSSETNYQFCCIELVMASKKMGPAPHFHTHLDEIGCVLEGTMGVMVGDTVKEIQAGGFTMRPHGVTHTFWNASDKPLRILEMYCNQNFDEYLEELFFGILPDMIKNNLTGADPGIAKRSADLHAEFGVTLFPEQRNAIIEKYGLIP